MSKLTAETITDEQIRELRDSLRRDLDKLTSNPAQFWTSHLRKAIVETDWALSIGEPIRALQARARCAEILNARAAGKEPR